MIHDTIAAIATPPGMGGIGIIRISGPESLTIAGQVFSRTRKKRPPDVQVFVTHQALHGFIFQPTTGNILDEVILIPMRAPRSYTREDVVEIQTHAGPAVMRAVLETMIACGARLASPGEFTRRAFVNGRIDLTQAEGIADMIQARSGTAMKLAAAQTTGRMKAVFGRARQRLIQVLALLEASIDFPEEDDTRLDTGQIRNHLKTVLDTCNQSIAAYDQAHFLRDGVKLAICGPPNAGKSSLMNALLDRERSIVTDIPGTTRDLVEEAVSIDGVPFVIGDTAGIHETADPVEQLGIAHTRRHISNADMVLYLYESGGAPTPDAVRLAIGTLDRRLLLVRNKCDLDPAGTTPDSLLPPLDTLPHVTISARHRQGLARLKQAIARQVDTDAAMSSTIVPNLRHKSALEQAKRLIIQASETLDHPVEAETLAIDIRMAADYFGELTGETAGIDVLDAVFERFCIGK